MAIDKKLNWRMLEKLHTLYVDGTPCDITKEIKGNDYIMNVMLKDKKVITSQSHGIKKKFHKTKKYDDFFKTEFEKEYYYLSQLLDKYEIEKVNSQLQVEDIKNLFVIENNKEDVKKLDIRGVSSQYFEQKDSKYLENSETLENAILKILGIDNWLKGRAKENQAIELIYPIGGNPKMIILSENRYIIKNPWIPMENNIQLWYAGGRNYKKLDHIPEQSIPIYYNCDWDWDGLDIYENIKERIPNIQLLTHYGKSKTVYTENHSSEWVEDKEFSGLNKNYYTNEQIEMIQNLIRAKEWIEEESLPLLTILEKNGITV